MTSPYEFTKEQWGGRLSEHPRFRTDQVWRGLWNEARELSDITSIPRSLREELVEEFASSLSIVSHVESDGGSTSKWAFLLPDGATVETVLMLYEDRATVCVSSQAGCAMGCTFCATGQAGFTRHLSPGEVLEQVMFAVRAAAPRRLSNVVFMGMGEPLANYSVTSAVLRRLHQDRGMSARHLTVSTVGVAPAIERLAREGLPVTLAVSLHAANDETRSELVPLNRRYPIARLREACQYWIETTGRRVSFEWALIDGVNDTDRALGELSALAWDLKAHVNLIPLNPTPGYLVRGSSKERVREFRDGLRESGIAVSIRDTRGRSIAAACGQLAYVTDGRRRAVSLRPRAESR